MKKGILPSDRGGWLRLGIGALLLVGVGGWLTAQTRARAQEEQRQAEVAAQKPSRRAQAPPHTRPLIEREGRRLLWADQDRATRENEWFDVTDSLIDPAAFQYGIGKDRIPSIDKPEFAELGDKRLREAKIDDATIVIGYAAEGEAKAYPIHVLDRHELVNDKFGDRPIAVGW